MRIGVLGLFNDPSNPNVPSAGYRGVTGLARLLSEDNEVVLYVYHKRRLSIDLPGCKVVPIHSRNPVIRWLKLTREIIRQREDLDVLFVHNPSIFVLPMVPLAKLLPIHVVMEFMDRQTATTHNPLNRYWVFRIVAFLVERLFLATMRNWITDHEEFVAIIRRANRKSNVMLYRTLIPLHPSGKEVKPSLLNTGGKVRIAYSGFLYHDHGVDILIDAFGKLPTDEVHLYITGFGPAKPGLENKIRKERLSNVTITFLENEEMDGFLAEMDILVIPYRNTQKMRTIGFSSKALHYMWAGKAIVTTAVGELPTLFEHDTTSIVVEPDNEEALKGALMDLVGNEEKRKRLGLNARRYFDDNFSPEAVKPKINSFLQDITGACG